jgi:hypothetical protein
MRVAVKGGVDPSDELVGGEQPCGLGDPALPRDPLGLDGVQPRALDRKLAGDDADAAPTPLDAAVVGTDPGAYGSAAVPGGVVADQQQRLRAGGLESGPAPGQVFSRDGAARAASDEAQPGLLLPPARVGCRAEQQAVAGQRLGSAASFATACSPSRRGWLGSTHLGRAGGARRLHPTSSWKPRPQVGGLAARRIRRSRPLFSGGGGVRAGDPALRALPADPEPLARHPDGLVAHPLGGQPLLEADFGGELERPPTRRLANGTRALVQEGAEACCAGRVDGGPDDLGPVRAAP